ncbi:hypothetical protein JCM17960_00870 [Magnetospira thiophila]
MFAICLMIVLVAFVFTRNGEQRVLRDTFDHNAQIYTQLLESRIRDILIQIDSTARFIENSQTLEPNEFRNFTRGTVEDTDEITSLLWVPRVADGQRQAFEDERFLDEMSRRPIHDLKASDGDSKFVPAPMRDAYFPVLYMQSTDISPEILGYDLGGNTEILPLLEQARDENEVVPLTGVPLPHRGDAGQAKWKGNVIFIQPVYGGSAAPLTIRQRRLNHGGFVLLEFDIGLALEAAVRRLKPRGTHIYIVDLEAAPGEEFIYFHPSRLNPETAPLDYGALIAKSGISFKSPLGISGRQWRIMMRPSAGFFENNPQYQSLIVLVLGTLLAMLLSYIAFVSQRQTQLIRETVRARTNELHVSEVNKQAVIENIAEGIITIDKEGIIESFNPAAEKMFGYAAEEVIGQSVNCLLPEKERAQHEIYIKNSTLYAPRIINAARDLYGRRRDGSEIPIELNISTMTVFGDTKFIGIMHDISDRLESQRRLHQAKENADRANAAKSDFLSSMSHELRTPLNAVLGFAQLLRQSKRQPLTERQDTHVQRIIESGEHLLALIDEILDLAKIEAGKISFSPDVVDTASLLDDCLAVVHAMAEKQNITLENRVGADVPTIWADRLRAKQALLNLLSNAIKYNRPDGKVRVEARIRGGDYLRFSVTDTGLGIAADKHKALFQPFGRLETGGAPIEGTGIGLFLTKKLVKEMDGRIGFDSTPGQGSTFWIELPLVGQGRAGAHPEDDSATPG